MTPLTIIEYTATSALGAGRAQHWQKLESCTSGLGPIAFEGACELSTWTGEVVNVNSIALPDALAKFDCRNNRLAWLGLQQDDFIQAVKGACERHGHDRVAVFIGTSTSGIAQTELAYKEAVVLGQADAQQQLELPDWYVYEGSHNTYSVAEFVRESLGLRGISAAISTACSSSAKVFASAHRALEAGLCDAAVVGGVDSLCLTTLHGFNALQLVSADKCRPCDIDRSGLSIGEAAGYALVERAPPPDGGSLLPQVLGYGESSDAYHMSSPHPEGDGAYQAMQQALRMAGLEPKQIDYINLHGTGTRVNDQVESLAVGRLFPASTPCSSTKGYTGHTLGAAGILEFTLTLLALENGFIPPSLNTRQLDSEIALNVPLQPQHHALQRALSNSFGFGGSNCSLVLGRAAT